MGINDFAANRIDPALPSVQSQPNRGFGGFCRRPPFAWPCSAWRDAAAAMAVFSKSNDISKGVREFIGSCPTTPITPPAPRPALPPFWPFDRSYTP